MIDVVLDLELDAWVDRQRADAEAMAARQIESARQHVDLVRRMYNVGDAAHAAGDAETAERFWTAARLLRGETHAELVDGELT